MATVLKNSFNYSSAIWANYNVNTVKNNIYANSPVILRGKSNASGGHFWICDGYKWLSIQYSDCTGISYESLHMIWGWKGRHDGWYNYSNFTPGNDNYNNGRMMIYNIIP